MNRESHIGLFDSGLGGLSILKEIKSLLPFEKLVYYADSANAPYGEKPKDQIIDISLRNTELLLNKGCKLIVVACNTATTNAINILRSNFKEINFIGIEPAIKPAALESKTKEIGVLATKGTLSSKLFEINSQKYKNNTTFIEVTGEGIVEAIEEDKSDTKEFKAHLKVQLEPFNHSNIDYLVLGCSHYPLISDQIKKCLNSGISVIDSGFAVAKQTKSVLLNTNLLNTAQKHQTTELILNGTKSQALQAILKKINLSNHSITRN
jgi:glutamate racemase